MVEALLFSDCHFDAEDSPFVMFVRSSVQLARGCAFGYSTHDPRLYRPRVLRDGGRLPRWLGARYRQSPRAELNALVMDFALPASLFVAMVQTPRAQLLQQSSLMLVLGVSSEGMKEGFNFSPMVSLPSPATPTPRSAPPQFRWTPRRTDERRSATEGLSAAPTAQPPR